MSHRVRFLEDFIYKPSPQSAILYEKGMVLIVKKECAEKAIHKGAAEYTEFDAPPSGLVATINNPYQRKKARKRKEKEVPNDGNTSGNSSGIEETEELDSGEIEAPNSSDSDQGDNG